MKRVNRISAACALGSLAVFLPSEASPPAGAATGFAVPGGSGQLDANRAPFAKSALAQTLGSRGTVTQYDTLYGGFELRSTTLVYILVRGNSLGTLGITQYYLDFPRVRIYNSAGQDLAFDNSGNAGFNLCQTSNQFSAPVRNYYATVRGVPAVDRDACNQGTLDAGSYSFTVTPSIPGVTTIPGLVSSPASGEVLFEITFNPS